MTTPAKNPAAAALGKLKRGVKEQPSEAKAASNRLNGAKGGRPKAPSPVPPVQPSLVLRQPRRVTEVVHFADNAEKVLFSGGRIAAKHFLADLRQGEHAGTPAFCLKHKGGFVPM